MSAARDISYAHSAQSRAGRVLIRAMENSTGRLGLIKRAEGYGAALANGACFWEEMAARYVITLSERAQAGLARIPQTGPLVMVANHPFGILDGLTMGRLLAARRGDFRILAHRVFRAAPELSQIILPVSFDETPEAQRANIAMRKEAVAHLRAGGAIGIFPGGTVSTPAKPFGRALDPGWRRFTAKLIAKSGAKVLPVCFEGSNSRLFHVASHLHPTLRMGLLISEFRRRIDAEIDLTVGDVIGPEALAPYAKDPKSMMDFLRQSTYALSKEPVQGGVYGHEFEARHRPKPE